MFQLRPVVGKLQEIYDNHAKQYIGINLDWNHDTHELICSMNGYVQQALWELKRVPSNCH